jgi:CubicO group peptidase (beta-lactamase class C family)
MKRFLKVSVIIAISIAVIYLLLPGYVIKAIWHMGPSIDDYKIFHNRVIKAGEHNLWDFHDNYVNSMESDSISSIIESYNPIAVLVIQNNKILYEEYWEGYDENSISNSFSASKAIVSLLVGIALDEGKIKDIDQHVGEFLPEFNKGSKKVLTIRHLLTMSSGLNWQETYSTPFSTTAEAYYGSDIESLINNLEVIEEPGQEFEYLSGNTQVLAMVVEAATGKRISDYASEKIWKHIGAKNDALWNLDKDDGMEKAYCCFNSNVRDFARFGQLVLNKGMWNGKRVISEEYLSEAISPKKYLIDKETGKPVDFYGYQWWIINYKGMEIPYMRGILGQYIYSIPDKNAVVVRLGHDRSSEYIANHPQDVYDYLDAAFLMLK